MKRILVTGGAGYIGSHTVAKLIDAGYDVVIYDNLSTGFMDAIHPQARFVFGDVRDEAKISRVMKEQSVEAVVHFAAKLIVSESVQDPVSYYDNNVLGTLAVMRACIENNVKRFVFSSTAAVYGDATSEQMVTEDSLVAPLNPYGSTKLTSEQMLFQTGQAHGINVVALRYFNVAGAALDNGNGQRTHNATHLIKVAAEAAVGKRSFMQVFGNDYDTQDGTCIRDYIHVEDLADVHVLTVKYLEHGGASQVMNCGYGKGFSVMQVIEAMKKVSGRDFDVFLGNRRPGDAKQLVANSSKAQRLLDWVPQRADLELICRTAYEWEKSQYVKVETPRFAPHHALNELVSAG